MVCAAPIQETRLGRTGQSPLPSVQSGITGAVPRGSWDVDRRNRQLPVPKQIRAKLNALSNTKTEGGEGKTNTTSENEMIATRLLEHKMGVEYNGKQVKEPDGFPLWIDQLVDKTIAELGPKYPMKTLLGTLGYLVVQAEGRR